MVPAYKVDIVIEQTRGPAWDCDMALEFLRRTVKILLSCSSPWSDGGLVNSASAFLAN